MIEKSYISFSAFFKAFLNRTRFLIIESLKGGEKTVKQIQEATGFEQSRVSHNLRRLERCGFIKHRRSGKNRIYSLDSDVKKIITNTGKYISKYGDKLAACSI